MEIKNSNIHGISLRIRDLMIYKKMNFRSFSKFLNYSDTAIANIIKGKSKPNFELIEKIIQKFPDVDNTWLVMGEGNMLRENKIHEKKTGTSKIIEGSSREEFIELYNYGNKEIELLKERLADKEKQIASLQSNMDIIIKAKDDLLNSKEEIIKQKEQTIKEKDDFIATQKAYIENLKKKESIIDALEIPHSKKVTFVKKGNTTEITEIKKGWPDGRNADITLPIQNT